jgi:hypothetical protein
MLQVRYTALLLYSHTILTIPTIPTTTAAAGAPPPAPNEEGRVVLEEDLDAFYLSVDPSKRANVALYTAHYSTALIVETTTDKYGRGPKV